MESVCQPELVLLMRQRVLERSSESRLTSLRRAESGVTSPRVLFGQINHNNAYCTFLRRVYLIYPRGLNNYKD